MFFFSFLARGTAIVMARENRTEKNKARRQMGRGRKGIVEVVVTNAVE